MNWSKKFPLHQK